MKREQRTGRRVAFTLIELLVVISIIAVMAGLLMAVLPGIIRTRDVKRLQGDHAALVTAIQNYKAGQGFYPAGNTNNPANTSLFYELRGVTVDATGNRFTNGTQSVDSSQLSTYFKVPGIANASGPGEPPAKDYFPSMPAKMAAAIPGTAIKRMVSGVSGLDGEPLPFNYDVTTPDRHNPDGFDLWIDYAFKGKTNRVANW